MKKIFMLFIVMFASLNMIATPVKTYNLNSLFPDKVRISYFMNENYDSIIVNNKYLPIHRYLNLEENQKDFFDQIHDDLKTSLDIFALKGNDYVETFRKHLYHDLRLSKMALEDDQYRKYLRTINVTLVNKNLINDLVNYEMSLKKDEDTQYED